METLKFAVLWPAGTVICKTEVANSWFKLLSWITLPPTGAAAARVTIPVALAPLPPAMTEGTSCSELTVCAQMAPNGLNKA